MFSRPNWSLLLLAGVLGWSISTLVVDPQGVSADVFVLKNGGRVEGELLNPEDAAKSGYNIRQLDGGMVTLVADDIAKVVPWTFEKRRYVELLPKMPTTADGNWKMARWCGEKHLAAEREFHLEEVIRLAPNHAEARKALGYIQVDGNWVQPDDIMRQRGFVRFQGRWRLPQDVATIEANAKAEDKIGEWKKNIRLWCRWIGGKQDIEATDNLRGITDPLAVPAILDLLASELRAPESNLAAQRLLIDLLGKLPTGDAITALSRVAMTSRDEEIRLLCLQHLTKHANPDLTQFFVKQLKSSDNTTIRRAAVALGMLGDASAVKPLVNSLVTQHQTVESAGNPNQISTAFGSGAGQTGSGFSTGSRPKVVNHVVENREVLDALATLTGVNFQFDQQAWLAWLIRESTKDIPVNLRRGE